jgi:hypothetical protein
VEVHTDLKSPLGKLLLANSITLTPGTLTVDIIGDRMWIHWIDITPGADLAHATRAIAEEFERLLKEFVLLTSPVGASTIARAARLSGLVPWRLPEDRKEADPGGQE